MSQQEDMVAHDAGHSADVGVTDLAEPGEFVSSEAEPRTARRTTAAENGCAENGVRRRAVGRGAGV